MSESQRRAYLFALSGLVFYLVGASFVQSFVSYPSWSLIGPAQFPAYYGAVAARIVKVMILPSVLELAMITLLLWARPRAIPRWPVLLAFVLVLARLVSTALNQLRFREQVMAGALSAGAVQTLIQWDYLTQLLSIGRAVLFAYMVGLVARNWTAEADR